jgi:UDP-N-acetylmuramoyl-L-alanyl-D-glutamate--2,6-diaminopimelate ligase
VIHSKSISQIFHQFPLPVPISIPEDVVITGIAIDSRKVQPGDLFIATRGRQFDAHRFIPQAIRKGAVAVVGMETGVLLDIPYIQVVNSRQAVAHLAAAFYDFPARKLRVIGVTGTDGKTTTCNLLYKILIAAGLKVGMISTVNAVIGDQVLDTGFHVTTPDSPDVQRYLAKMVSAGLTHVILETTSHGWAQYRVDACEIDVGVVTNITHEHLDEHGSYQNYLTAKARLFESLAVTVPKPWGNPRLAVLNADDSSFGYLKNIHPSPCQSYGLSPGADITAKDIHSDLTGIRFTAFGSGWDVMVTSKLVGAYNILNCLAALTVAVSGLGINPGLASDGIARLEGISGRMELIDLGQNFTAIVDFAHTPNALKNAIATARKLTNGKVIVAFGSAGLRDTVKRYLMAEIGAENADLTILTAEDPRTEPLDRILEEMAVGARSKGSVENETFWTIPDRRKAIRFSLSLALPGDVVMVCGKGHEQSMCFGEIEYPWDDRLAMRAALAEYLGVEGPEMPFLPT